MHCSCRLWTLVNPVHWWLSHCCPYRVTTIISQRVGRAHAAFARQGLSSSTPAPTAVGESGGGTPATGTTWTRQRSCGWRLAVGVVASWWSLLGPAPLPRVLPWEATPECHLQFSAEWLVSRNDAPHPPKDPRRAVQGFPCFTMSFCHFLGS